MKRRAGDIPRSTSNKKIHKTAQMFVFRILSLRVISNTCFWEELSLFGFFVRAQKPQREAYPLARRPQMVWLNISVTVNNT
jgi:hypothetical protein